MTDLLQNRAYLHKRHRLSHQQIDSLLDENRSGEYLQEKIKRLELVRHFLLLTDTFRQNNIPFISMKGPLLSFRLYGDPAVRISRDIDLLINEKDIGAAIKLMQAEGYEFDHDFIWPFEKHRQELITQSIHHVSFFNRELHLYVEVHWVLANKLAVPMKKVEKIIAKNLTTIILAEREFIVMNKEFDLLFLLLHGARHGWSRLKWLADIDEYTRQKIDEKLFVQLVKQLKAKRIISQTNYLLQKYFDSHLTVPCKNRAPNRMIQFAKDNINKSEVKLDTTVREILNTMKYQWLLFPSLYYKYRFLTDMFIRNVDILNNNLPNKIAYFLYRPYSFIKRRVFHG